MRDLKARLAAFRFSELTVPLALLVLCALTYGLLIPWLGYSWDDLAFVWIAEKLGTPGLVSYFASARPIWGLFIRADLYLLGNTPWVWQVFGIFWRWVCAVMMWATLRLLWPQQGKAATWAAFLFVVYPGFDQQYIPINFGHFFMVYSALLFSFGAMLAAVRRLVGYWRWTALALVFCAVNLLCMEYFYLLELLRPLLLWLVLSELVPDWRTRLRRVITLWLPYLAVFLCVSIWRAFFFQNQTLGHRPELLGRIAASPLSALLALSYTVLHDLYLVTVQAWFEAFRLPDADLLGGRTTILYSALVLLAGVAVFLYLWRLNGKKEPTAQKSNSPAWFWQAGGLGLASLFIAGWPFWLTDLYLGLKQPNSRFTLPFTLGVGLLLAALVSLIPRHTWLRAALLAVLVGASVGYQFQVASSYRRAFNAQKQLFWQMAWRMPGLKDGTALLFNDLPIPYVTDNSLSAMLNWIYAPNNHTQRMSYILYFPSIRQDTVLHGMQPGQDIVHNYWAAVFYGNTSQVTALNFQPPACLRLLDPQVDPQNPMISILLRQSAQLSSWEWVQPSPGQPASPPTQVYGSEPPHGWCYYYEKAELARQQKDWEGVVKLGDEGFKLGEYPNDPAERYPFIEAYAHTGMWSRAVDLGTQAAAITPLVHPALCHLWQRIEAETPASPEKASSLAQARSGLECQ